MTRLDGHVDEVILTGVRTVQSRPRSTEFTITPDPTAEQLAAWRTLRREVFVSEQGLFSSSDTDVVDDDPRLRTLLAIGHDGAVLGGVRVHPAQPGPEIGWWRGSRLAVGRSARRLHHIGPALIRAACALAEAEGALRFDATIQARHEALFVGLGWSSVRPLTLHGQPHLLMNWPLDRIQRRSDSCKSMLGSLLHDLTDVPRGFLGDDGVPVRGSDFVAACDAILPSMVERDPEWAGWCSILVNLNDLFAMGARPVGVLDAVAGRDASFVRRVLIGVRDAARAYGVPVLGGHTQVGVPAALSVTALGRTSRPVPGGGAVAGDRLRLTADLGGDWRPAYTGAQWDSTSHRSPDELRSLAQVVPNLAPSAAKDVSMAGFVGTVGMLTEASGCGAVIDVDMIPRPESAGMADWLTCFPGFAMATTERAGGPDRTVGLPRFLDTALCGEMVAGSGVRLRWPDGIETTAVEGPVTRMGAA